MTIKGKNPSKSTGDNVTVSAAEQTLDNANEMSFPASDPVSSSNITRIEKAPEVVEAAGDHQNSNTLNSDHNPKAEQQKQQQQSQHQLADLHNITVAILVTDGFEEAELLEPKHALEAVGVKVHVISDKKENVQGFRHTDKGEKVKVDRALSEALPGEYSAVLLPGGVVNGDALRMSTEAREFVQSMNEASKPIASICHGGWLLISAGIVKDRTLTSWPSLQDDFTNAMAKWVDQEVVCDENFLSSRKPDDIPAFNAAFISMLR